MSMQENGGARYMAERAASERVARAKIINEYAVSSLGIVHKVLANNMAEGEVLLTFFVSGDKVAVFRTWDWWTEADKPLNIKTEDK